MLISHLPSVTLAPRGSESGRCLSVTDSYVRGRRPLGGATAVGGCQCCLRSSSGRRASSRSPSSPIPLRTPGRLRSQRGRSQLDTPFGIRFAYNLRGRPLRRRSRARSKQRRAPPVPWPERAATIRRRRATPRPVLEQRSCFAQSIAFTPAATVARAPGNAWSHPARFPGAC
jgi:hypothetical protein